jgi:HPt (histidine-containing phosphotransfer) domain-containing protein
LVDHRSIKSAENRDAGSSKHLSQRLNITEVSSLASDEGLVDHERLAQLEDIARDHRFLGELIAGFITDVDAILWNADRAIATGHKGAMSDLMHSLKGAAVSVGAGRSAEFATKLDRAAADGTPIQELRTTLDRTKSCFESTSGYLNRFLESRQERVDRQSMH